LNLEQLLKKLEAALAALLVTEPNFTGSLSLEMHFKDGQAKDIIKQVERNRVKV